MSDLTLAILWVIITVCMYLTIFWVIVFSYRFTELLESHLDRSRFVAGNRQIFSSASLRGKVIRSGIIAMLFLCPKLLEKRGLIEKMNGRMRRCTLNGSCWPPSSRFGSCSLRLSFWAYGRSIITRLLFGRCPSVYGPSVSFNWLTANLPAVGGMVSVAGCVVVLGVATGGPGALFCAVVGGGAGGWVGGELGEFGGEMAGEFIYESTSP